MKKSAIVTLVILALLVSMLPMSTAMAAKPAKVSIFVNNATGGTVALTLVGASGYQNNFSYLPGMSATSLVEGIYSYRASTPCGLKIGKFNLTRNRQLEFFCPKGSTQITLNTVSAGPNHR